MKGAKTMKYCANCGGPVENTTVICTRCGARTGIIPQTAIAPRPVASKYCPYCGSSAHAEAVVCVRCGRSLPDASQAAKAVPKDNALALIVKIFMIIGCIAQGWLIIPLVWCILLTVHVFNKMKTGERIGTGVKVCSLLFVNLIAGICMLCSEDI